MSAPTEPWFILLQRIMVPFFSGIVTLWRLFPYPWVILKLSYYLFLFLGILPLLGNIQLTDVSDHLHDQSLLFNFDTKNRLAIFTENLSPNERRQEFKLQFQPYSKYSMIIRLKRLFLSLSIIICLIICLVNLRTCFTRNWKSRLDLWKLISTLIFYRLSYFSPIKFC